MAAFRNTLLLVLLGSVACLGQGKHDHANRESRHHSGVSKPPAALVEQPAPPQVPAPPPTTSQLPATAPQVSYGNGLLTVVANNSTLGDILNAVRSKTGASIDYPANQAQDRVVASYGPGPATQVLASLLNGSRFDYILLGSPGRPDLLSKAILTSKEAAVPETSSASASAANKNVPTPQPADEDADTQEDNAVEQPVEQPPQPQPQQPAPTPQNQPGQAQQPKTPEQLLQELQRLQQQNQPQNQQQGAQPEQQQNPQQ